MVLAKKHIMQVVRDKLYKIISSASKSSALRNSR